MVAATCLKCGEPFQVDRLPAATYATMCEKCGAPIGFVAVGGAAPANGSTIALTGAFRSGRAQDTGSLILMLLAIVLGLVAFFGITSPRNQSDLMAGVGFLVAAVIAGYLGVRRSSAGRDVSLTDARALTPAGAGEQNRHFKRNRLDLVGMIGAGLIAIVTAGYFIVNGPVWVSAVAAGVGAWALYGAWITVTIDAPLIRVRYLLFTREVGLARVRSLEVRRVRRTSGRGVTTNYYVLLISLSEGAAIQLRGEWEELLLLQSALQHATGAPITT